MVSSTICYTRERSQGQPLLRLQLPLLVDNAGLIPLQQGLGILDLEGGFTGSFEVLEDDLPLTNAV